MGKFIKSKTEMRAFNRDYISYIRIAPCERPDRYKVVIGYAPCNDYYAEKILADDLNQYDAESVYDKYLLELEEEPLQEYIGDNLGWR